MVSLKKWKIIVLLAAIIILTGCVDPQPSTPTSTPTPIVSIEKLLSDLDADKDFTFGYKSYYPLTASPAMSQLISIGPGALPDILKRMETSEDPQYRKALLFVIAQIDDPRSEEALISGLEDEDLNGLSAYLLGNYYYRPPAGEYNKPDKFLRNKGKVINALFPLLRNNKEYPIKADRFEANPQVGDLAIASYIRIGGVENFAIDQYKYSWIGWDIPEFTEKEREVLLRESETFFERTGGEDFPPTDGGRLGEIPRPNKNETNVSVANGTFTFTKERNNSAPNRSEVYINFTALSTLDCTKILFIQVARITDSAGNHVYPGGPRGRMAGRATGDGYSLDRYDDITSPYYGTDNAGNEMSNTNSGRPGGDQASLWDRPRGFPGDTYEFETCAICTAGADAGKCYGCMTWGFRINADGSITPSPESGSNTPSNNFKSAADNWNSQAGNTAIPRVGW